MKNYVYDVILRHKDVRHLPKSLHFENIALPDDWAKECRQRFAEI